jgi:hypothetical protein
VNYVLDLQKLPSIGASTDGSWFSVNCSSASTDMCRIGADPETL